MTKSQRRVLRQAHQGNGTKSCSRALANQLAKLGLATIDPDTADRYEWQRKVSSLPIVVLTDEGHAVAQALIDELNGDRPCI